MLKKGSYDIQTQKSFVTQHKYQQKSKIQDPAENDVDKLRNYIGHAGIVRGQWLDNGKLKNICYGSAIAISRRIILTCAHSVYIQDKKKVCTSATFIFGHSRGKLQIDQKIYNTSHTNFIAFKKLGQGQTYKTYPTPLDIALLYLSEDLDLVDFPAIGVEKQNKDNFKSDIILVGYPSQQYYCNPHLKSIDFKRKILEDNYFRMNSDSIQYRLNTQLGHSGSAIIGVNNKTDEPTILGVHTHRGQSKSTGVLLNDHILLRLARFQIDFAMMHEEYFPCIKFPENIMASLYADKVKITNKRNYRVILSQKIKQITDGVKKEDLTILKLLSDILVMKQQTFQRSKQQLLDVDEQQKVVSIILLEMDMRMKDLQGIILSQKRQKISERIQRKNKILCIFEQIKNQLYWLRKQILKLFEDNRIVSKIKSITEHLQDIKRFVTQFNQDLPQEQYNQMLEQFYDKLQIKLNAKTEYEHYRQ